MVPPSKSEELISTKRNGTCDLVCKAIFIQTSMFSRNGLDLYNSKESRNLDDMKEEDFQYTSGTLRSRGTSQH